MTFRSPRLLACFLSLLCAGSALGADPQATNSHFQITKSFPVSEATWAEKVGDLFLVAAQRSVLVYRKTGPGEADYQEVNRLFPGLDGAYGFLVSDQYVKTVQILAASMQTLTTNHTSVLNGGGLLNPQGVFLRDSVIGVPTTMEGVRFYSVTNPTIWSLLANVDLPSRHEGVAKHGSMVYVTTDIDGVWQLDWEAAGGPKASRRIPLKGLSEDLTLRGNYVYVANGIGLATIDVSDPANPHEVHYWDFPYPGAPDINQGWVEGVGQLQSAPALHGPWVVISNAVNPHVASTGPAEFLRVKVQ